MFRRGEQSDDKLVQALEALLEGRYAEFLQRKGDRVPPWAWTNLLAHGSEDDLRRATRIRRRPPWELNIWRRAQSYLAGEVLDAASRAGSLTTLQSQTLVPLEFNLVGWVPSRYTSAGQWATLVLLALENHDRDMARKR